MSLLALPSLLPADILPPATIPATGTALVTIGGAAVTIQHGSISVNNAVGQRSTGSVVVEDVLGTAAYLQGQPVSIIDDHGNTAFSGVVATVDRQRPAQTAMREHTVQIADWHYLADKRVAPYSATNVTAGQIARDMVTQFLAAEGVTVGTIQPGPIVVSLLSAYGLVSDVLDALVQKAGAGWYWLIDQQRRLQFQQQTTAPLAPFVADETIMERGTVKVTHGNTQYRNTQYMLGGVAQTSSQTETRQGDGKATAFTLSYQLASAPTITLNSVAQTVGIKGVDTGKNWYWAAGDAVVAQDTSGAKLISTDTLSVTYIGQFPSVAISQDSAAVAAQQARETYGTGIVEAAAFDATLTSVSQAFQSAAGLLSKYAHDLDTITFLTTQYGLAEGQLLTVNVPADGLNNEVMLIESVTISDVGPASAEVGPLWYQVTAVSGPLNTGWVQFFKHLSSQQSSIIDSITVGQAQTLALLQSSSVAFTWTVTGTATVNALLIPQTTLFPQTTLYPGTAGTPVAITWTKPQAGLNAMRDVLSGVGTSLKVGYFAWGTGTQGTPATATQLAAEVGRKLVTSITNGSNPGEELINEYLSPQDAVGVAISEIAFFAGPAANGNPNTGTMVLYGLYSHTKSALESIQFQVDSTLS